ncbi:hypothetical protein [Pseudarthrobacter phenanthrenivorans]|uniref:hypothetical protein n=1 Tax=Pseudarthrobacter phenanthrenivorans TaxID=361575 RepID=UPI001C7D900B|nr:hypothetical protein [Pseudarthrobacter phenanthrenivorans]
MDTNYVNGGGMWSAIALISAGLAEQKKPGPAGMVFHLNVRRPIRNAAHCGTSRATGSSEAQTAA